MLKEKGQVTVQYIIAQIFLEGGKEEGREGEGEREVGFLTDYRQKFSLKYSVGFFLKQCHSFILHAFGENK